MSTTNRTVVFVLLAGILSVAGIFIFLDINNRCEQLFADQVADIWSAGQLYDGEYTDKLAALGPDAVPAIGVAMLEAGKFQLPYITALARIESPDAVEPLLELLARQEPVVASYRTTIIVQIIHALEAIGDTRATAPLLEIMRGTAAHPSDRLAAAGALTRISTGKTKSAAEEFIKRMYADRNEYYGQRGAGFEQADMHRALIAMDNADSIEILSGVLDGFVDSYLALPIIQYFSDKDQPAVADLLYRTAQRTDSYELPVRLAAFTAVLAMNHGLTPSDIVRQTDTLITEAKEGGWPEDVVNRAETLRTLDN